MIEEKARLSEVFQGRVPDDLRLSKRGEQQTSDPDRVSSRYRVVEEGAASSARTFPDDQAPQLARPPSSSHLATVKRVFTATTRVTQ